MIGIQTILSRIDVDPADRDRIIKLRDAVIALFEAKTKRKWTRAVGHEKTFNFANSIDDRKQFLWADRYPIETIVITEWNMTELEVDADTLTVDDQYVVDNERGRVTRTDSLTWDDFVKFVITGGYADDALPAAGLSDVEDAIILQMQYHLQRNSNQRIAEQSTSAGDGSTASHLTKSCHPAFEEIARSHRRFVH